MCVSASACQERASKIESALRMPIPASSSHLLRLPPLRTHIHTYAHTHIPHRTFRTVRTSSFVSFVCTYRIIFELIIKSCTQSSYCLLLSKSTTNVCCQSLFLLSLWWSRFLRNLRFSTFSEPVPKALNA